MRLSSRSEDTAHAIFDWVIDNVDYRKTGAGWGNGDTHWACLARYGNCTDFHALFISLARTEGVPARFDMGFPISEATRSGVVAGYHCWVEVWLDEVGWMPIDASEASKQPGDRDRFYGAQPADRVRFSTGRDLRLGRDHAGPRLNYFIAPYVEVGGQAYDGPVDLRVRFEELHGTPDSSTREGAAPSLPPSADDGEGS